MYPLFVLGFLAVRRHCAKISLVIIHLAVSQPRSLAAPLVTLPATVAVLPPSTAALALAGAGLGGAGLLAGAGLGAAAASKSPLPLFRISQESLLSLQAAPCLSTPCLTTSRLDRSTSKILLANKL